MSSKMRVVLSNKSLWTFLKGVVLLIVSSFFSFTSGFSFELTSRRQALGWMSGATTASFFRGNDRFANALEELPASFDVDSYLKSGFVLNPMGVSGQAGKSRPETGVLLRDGSEVSRDPRTGEILAEIILTTISGEKVPVLASYSSTWPLATGSVFDVECRDLKTGDTAFLAVSSSTGGKSISELKDSFFTNNLFAPKGRFSSYGQPTDIKVRKNSVTGAYRVLDLSFSTLSQSTQTEIPRRARLIATIPEGTHQAVMLIGSAADLRWRKGSEKEIEQVINSFRAIPAPQTNMKVRAKERRNQG